MQSIKRLAITFLSALLISALLLPSIAFAGAVKQNRLLPLALGDVPVDATTFPDPDFLWWAKQQSWASDGVLSTAEAQTVTFVAVGSLGVRDLTGIEYFPNLESISCIDNYITRIDASGNPKLKSILAWGNPEMSFIDVTQNPLLETLFCSSAKLASLDLSNNPELVELGVAHNQIQKLDMTNKPNLGSLDCSGNQLSELDVTGSPLLIELLCGGNHLTTLDLSKNTRMLPVYLVGFGAQRASAAAFSPDNGATRYVDLAEVVGKDRLDKILTVRGGAFDATTGLVLLDETTDNTISYNYDVGYSYKKNGMDVTLTLNTVAAEMIDVSYDLAEGSTPNKTTLARGSRLTKPTDPTREGYKFLGWHTEDAQGDYVLWDFSTPVTAPITLVARWQKLTDNPAEEKPVVKDKQPVSQQPSAQKAAATPPAIPATGNTDIVLAIVATGLVLLALALLATSWRLRARRR